MGAAQSSPATAPTPSPSAPVKIGEGLFGVVYATGDTVVTKKQKIPTSNLGPHTEAWKEARAFDWIDSIRDKQMQRFFARRIRQVITYDPSWKHMPKFYVERVAVMTSAPDRVTQEDKEWLTRTTAMLQEHNAYAYVHEVSMECKGRRIQKDLITRAKLNKGIVELLTVIHFMQQQGVMHSDIHPGNIVIQPDGSIALIDYGDIYFKGDLTYERHAAEHLMMMQFVGTCTDVTSNFEIEEALEDATAVTDIFQRVATALETGDMANFLEDMCDKLSYSNPVGKARTDPRMHDLVVCVLFDRMKLKYPAEFKRMMGWPDTSVLHSWITREDLDFVFMHMSNLPTVIEYFKNKIDVFNYVACLI